MTTTEEQRFAAAIGWALDNYQVPQSLSNVAGDQKWKYTGAISNSELRLYEEGGASIVLDRKNVIELLPPSPEKTGFKYGERKWLNGIVNGSLQNAAVFLHDNMKVSRVFGFGLEISSSQVRVEDAETYLVL